MWLLRPLVFFQPGICGNAVDAQGSHLHLTCGAQGCCSARLCKASASVQGSIHIALRYPFTPISPSQAFSKKGHCTYCTKFNDKALYCITLPVNLIAKPTEECCMFHTALFCFISTALFLARGSALASVQVRCCWSPSANLHPLPPSVISGVSRYRDHCKWGFAFWPTSTPGVWWPPSACLCHQWCPFFVSILMFSSSFSLSSKTFDMDQRDCGGKYWGKTCQILRKIVQCQLSGILWGRLVFWHENQRWIFFNSWKIPPLPFLLPRLI